MTSRAQVILELHDKAMELADIALFARRNGDEKDFRQASRQAFELEKKAALMIESEDSEPTRSVFHRSAAILALDCGEYREAEKLIGRALSGNPPGAVYRELRELYETVKLEQELRQDDISLGENELELSVHGNRVGYGFAPVEAVVSRVKSVETLLQRTVCQLSKREYSKSIPAMVRKSYGLMLGVPTAGSFNVILKAWHERQLDLPGVADFNSLDDILDKVMHNIRLVSEGEFGALKDSLPSPAYFRSFVGVARRIAPDGKSVSSVALRAKIAGQKRQIKFTRKQSDIPAIPHTDELALVPELENIHIHVIGSLKYADALNKNEVKLVDNSGSTWTVEVPEGSMEEVVRPYFGETVEVHGMGSRSKRCIRRLQKIDDIESA